MAAGVHNVDIATASSFTERKESAVHFSKSDVERFWTKVDKSGECWLWTAGRIGGKGDWYGRFSVGGRNIYAHRSAWILTHGPIPDGLEVCHQCDVPACCNPSHLFLGTHRENNQDAARKGRFHVRRPTRQKVTTDQLAEIDVLLAAGAKQVDIAHYYGVSKTWVCLYVKGLRRQYDCAVTE